MGEVISEDLNDSVSDLPATCRVTDGLIRILEPVRCFREDSLNLLRIWENWPI